MGVPDRTAMYGNCGHGAHAQWPSSAPGSTPLQPQQQQQQQQQHYDRVPPPPYPGHSRQVFSNLPGFRQSYSGSDTSTDMSLSSTENLASWPRQEPQGEETAPATLPNPHPHPHPHPSLDNGPGFSVLASRMPLVAESPSGSMERLSASPVSAPCSTSSFSSGSGHSQTGSATSTSSSSGSGHSQTGSATSTSSSSGAEDLSGSGGSASLRLQQQQQQHHHHHQHQHQQQQQQQQHLTVPSRLWSQEVPPPHSGRYFRSVNPTYHHPHPYVNQNWTVGEGGGGEQQGSSRVVTYVPFLPPPPQYPGPRRDGGQGQGQGGCGDGGKAGASPSRQSRFPSDPVRSPDGGAACVVSALRDSGVYCDGQRGSYLSSDTIFTALTQQRSPRVRGGSQGGTEHMVNLLNEESRQLQDELVQCYIKIARLQKLEQEIGQVQEAYQSLVRSTEKRERLEAAIKSKLQEEVLKLQAHNAELKAQVQKAETTRKMRSRSEGRGGAQRDTESVAGLRQLLQDKHSKVQQLEAQLEQWEQRCSQLQSAQLAAPGVGVACCKCPSTTAKNSRKVSQRLHEEAQHDKQQQAEELSQSQRRIAELEAKVTWLTNQLADREKTDLTHHPHPHHQHHASPPPSTPPSLQEAPVPASHLPPSPSLRKETPPPHLTPSPSLRKETPPPHLTPSPSLRKETPPPHLTPCHSPQHSSQSSGGGQPGSPCPQAQNKVQLWQV